MFPNESFRNAVLDMHFRCLLRLFEVRRAERLGDVEISDEEGMPQCSHTSCRLLGAPVNVQIHSAGDLH